jgi:hypothetical protein
MKGAKVTPMDLAVMDLKDDITLAEWYCALNLWDWPKALPDEESGDECRRRDPEHGCRRLALMDEVVRRVGDKLCSRIWNRERMTVQEHDDFWRGTYEGDEEAKERYVAWRKRKADEFHRPTQKD